jgi:catechol 2,3-dioxygenase-like lactoylglutathione lyase family enzyme
MKRIILITALAFCCACAYAGDNKLTFNHVTLIVSDIEASEEFYVGVLKLEKLKSPFGPSDDPFLFLSLGGGTELHMGEIEGVEVGSNGINHFAMAVDDFDGFLEYLKSSGVIYGDLGGGNDYHVTHRPDGVRQVYITDPDGYWIEINDVK